MEHISLLNFLIQKYQYKSYLEIGCNQNICFDRINVSHKIGVDPYSGGTYRITSDKYFELYDEKFDLIFIDGLHWSEQVFRDIYNSLRCLNKNGIIVLHDCNPVTEYYGFYPRPPAYKGDKTWNGDVWKAIVHYRQDPNLDIVVGNFDWGCGLLRKKPNTDLLYVRKFYTNLTYQELERNRQKWLRLVSEEELKKWLDT